jgi:hypothetical protein
MRRVTSSVSYGMHGMLVEVRERQLGEHQLGGHALQCRPCGDSCKSIT